MIQLSWFLQNHNHDKFKNLFLGQSELILVLVILIKMMNVELFYVAWHKAVCFDCHTEIKRKKGTIGSLDVGLTSNKLLNRRLW